MPLIDIMDDTFVAAAPSAVAEYLADPAVWRSWWPALTLTVHEDRGIEGIRWYVAGPIVGTAEVWIEEYEKKGCIVHFFLRGDPARPRRFRRRARARTVTRRYTVAWKRRVHALKDALEGNTAWVRGPRGREPRG